MEVGRGRGIIFGISKFQIFGLGAVKFDTPGFKSVGRSNLRPGSIRPLTDRRDHVCLRDPTSHVVAEISPAEVGARGLFSEFRNFRFSNFLTWGGEI